MRMALLGASGCGKSVTLKCIAGIMTPDRGHIILDGETLFDSEKNIDFTLQMRQMGYLFQQYALFPNMTVLQNIRCGIRWQPRRKAPPRGGRTAPLSRHRRRGAAYGQHQLPARRGVQRRRKARWLGHCPAAQGGGGIGHSCHPGEGDSAGRGNAYGSR